MAELEYGKEYKYAHDYENHFVKQEYLPKEILGETFVERTGKSGRAQTN